MGIEYNDIVSQNQDNLGGMPDRIYYFIHSDVAEFPVLPKIDDASGLEGNNVLTGNLVLKPGKKLYILDITHNSGSIEDNASGEFGGIGHKHQLKFKLDSRSKRNKGFSRYANQERLGFLVPEPFRGTFEAVGCTELYPAFRSPEGGGKTGEGPEGKKGFELSFESAGPGPVPDFDLTTEQLQALLDDNSSSSS